VLEQEARAAKRGLWADPSPVPPWEWRKAARAHQRGAALQAYPIRCPHNGQNVSRSGIRWPQLLHDLDATAFAWREIKNRTPSKISATGK